MVVPLSFTVNLYHDGVFQVNPLEYVNFDSKLVMEMIAEELHPKKLISHVDSDSDVETNHPLSDVAHVIELYEHEDEDGGDINMISDGHKLVMEMIAEELHPKKLISHVDSDSDVETNHPLSDVAHVIELYEHEDEGNVNIPRMTTDDPWLNKLVESKFKAKKNVSYPSFNPDTPWNECKPMLGMRFESPQQLKHMLANYGVQHGYQLWYMQNDHNKLLVFCGRDVSEDKCVGLKGRKPKTVDNEECESSKQGSKNDDGRKVVNEILSKAVKERWDKKKEYEKKRVSKQALVSFSSGYREIEVRRRDQSFGVNLHQMKYVCNMWQLSVITCVHSMASMPPPTATPSSSNTLPPPPTPSSSNTMTPPLTPSTSNTILPPPTPSTSNTMTPPPTPSDSNTIPSDNVQIEYVFSSVIRTFE
nr:hypothetical protein [Tanacetum cinerariifolium]